LCGELREEQDSRRGGRKVKGGGKKLRRREDIPQVLRGTTPKQGGHVPGDRGLTVGDVPKKLLPLFRRGKLQNVRET